MTRYDQWKTDPSYGYGGERLYRTLHEEDLYNELIDLEKQEGDLEDQLEEVREKIVKLREELGYVR